MVSPANTPQALIEEWVDEINTLITANAHAGLHNASLHLAANVPQQAGLQNCPRCRLTLLTRYLEDMVRTLDDTIVPPHKTQSSKDEAFTRLKAIRDREKAGGPP